MEEKLIHVINGEKITVPSKSTGDGITVYGPYGETIIRNCVIDFRGQPLSAIDEALSGVNGAKANVHNCRITESGKGILWGKGDHPENDQKGSCLLLENCIIENIGRRAPEAQDGVYVIMRRCLIRNWGIGSRFSVRSFGAWAHDGATIQAVDCVFWQDRFFQAGLRGMIVDLANWIGWSWNRRDMNPMNWLLPGVCRGLTSSQGGNVGAINCYANKWWIVIQGHMGKRMSREDAMSIKAALEKKLSIIP